MFRILILATVIPAIFATEGIERCNGGQEMPLDTTVVGCSSTPCDVTLGQDANLKIVFTAPRTIPSFRPVVRAFLVGGINVPYPLPDEQLIGCNFLDDGAVCPIAAGTTVTYNFALLLGANYPALSLNVELSLEDDVGTFSCSRIRINARRP